MARHVLGADQESVVSSARGRSEPTKPESEDFQVGPGTLVTLTYRAFDEEGDQVAASEESGVEVVFGCGQLLPRLEQALAGLMPGDERAVELEPADAFGEWDQGAVLEIDPSEFPAETAPGDEFEAENLDGMVLLFKVLDVTPDAVLLDTNHPLAGQRVRFALEVRAVRPATEAELRVAADRALANSEPPPSPDLVAPGRLLPQGRRR
jgi:FKBP-type peptidyl-prolyl cis-trans isomerase SlyD